MKKPLSALLASLTNAPDPVSELERTLTDLNSSRDAATARLAGLDGERREALVDGDSAALATVRELRFVLEDEAESLAMAIAEVSARLAQVHELRRQAQLADHRAAHEKAVKAFLKLSAPALAAFNAILFVRAQAIEEGFANAMRALDLPPNINGNPILSPEALRQFEDRETPPPPRVKRASAAKLAGSERVAAPIPSPVVAPVSASVVAFAERTPHRETPKDGEAVVTVLRSGLEYPGRGLLVAGDEIAVSTENAAALVRSGAADFASVPSNSV